MRRIPAVGLALFLLMLAAACSTTTGGQGGTRRSADLITQEELQTVSNLSVYDAVRRLRPAWLRVRSAAAQPVVFVDGARVGDVNVLNSYRAAEFVEIRHRNGRDATTLYGTGVGGGTIELSTRGRTP